MGIREYFKQHPENEDLKMQNMVIKERIKKDTSDFDVREDVLDAVREYMKSSILQRIESGLLNDIAVAEDVAMFKVLFPEEINALGINNENWQVINKQLMNRAKKTDCFFAFFVACPKDKNFQVQENEWTEMQEELYDSLGNIDGMAFIKSKMRIFFPNRFKELKIDKYFLDQIKKSIEKIYDSRLQIYDDVECYDEFMIKLFPILMSYKILTAKRLEYTDRGIKFIMIEEKFEKEKRTQRPERKNF